MSYLWKNNKKMRVSFTGNRSAPRTSDLMHRLHDQVEDYIKKGVIQFNVGGSTGGDTWMALSVLKHKEKYPTIKLHLYIPCLEQDKLWTVEQKKQYKEILEKCDKIIQISDEPYTKQCMLFRDLRLVENCDYLLSLFDGEPKGGSWQTITMAIKTESVKEIYIIKF